MFYRVSLLDLIGLYEETQFFITPHSRNKARVIFSSITMIFNIYIDIHFNFYLFLFVLSQFFNFYLIYI